MKLWLVMIVLHAAFALLAFICGLLVLHKNYLRRFPRLLNVFILTTILMTIAVAAATLSHWQEITAGERVAFSLLPILAIYMIYRALKARKALQANNHKQFIDDIGFALISYFDGFIIVAMIDLGAPVWLTVTAAVAAVFFGNRYLNQLKAKKHGA